MNQLNHEELSRRVWPRASDNEGRGIIPMEPEYWDLMRHKLLYEMTNHALTYLWHCGHDPGELTVLGPSLFDALGEWWDEYNEFAEPSSDKALEKKAFRVFWRPYVPSDEPDEKQSTDAEE